MSAEGVEEQNNIPDLFIFVTKRTSVRPSMASLKGTGIIEKTVKKKTCEEAQVEWRIPGLPTAEINDTTVFYYESPTFCINDICCFLRLYPKSARSCEFMRMYISTNVLREYSSQYNISLKKLDGSVEQLLSGSLEKNVKDKIKCDMGDIIKRSELLQRKSELAPQNILMICTLKQEINHPTEPSDKAMSLKLISLDKLSENFKALFTDKETCDVTLKVKDKEFKAHKSVLIARSSVFAANFKHDTLETQTGVITITDCDPDSFAVFLEYLYCGKLEEEFSVCSALHLYYTSDKYDVLELKTFCVQYLMQYLTVENVCEVAALADTYDETELFSAVQEFFNENVRKIFRSPEWDYLLTKNHRLANKLLIAMSDMKH